MKKRLQVTGHRLQVRSGKVAQGPHSGPAAFKGTPSWRDRAFPGKGRKAGERALRYRADD
jgi:hypothetical protein